MMKALAAGEKEDSWRLADWTMWLIRQFSTAVEQKEQLLDELADAMWAVFTRTGWLYAPIREKQAPAGYGV